MTFRTSASLARQYESIKQFAEHLKQQCASARTRMAAGAVPIYDISTGLLGVLVEASHRFTDLPSGIGEYAQQQDGGAEYDVAAEFHAMRTSVLAARDWLISNLPRDASNRLLERTLNADGTITLVTVSTAQTAALRTLLTAVEATIE